MITAASTTLSGIEYPTKPLKEWQSVLKEWEQALLVERKASRGGQKRKKK